MKPENTSSMENGQVQQVLQDLQDNIACLPEGDRRNLEENLHRLREILQPQGQQANQKNPFEASQLLDRVRRALSIDTVGILFLDLEGQITDGNDAFLRMIGYSREELEGGLLRWADLTPAEFFPASLQAMEEVRVKEESSPYEKQYIRKDGSRLWGLFAAKRLDENEIVEFVLDITDRKAAEAALHEAELTLRQSAARQAFLLKLSDTLRPMTDAVEIRSAACRLIGETLGADRAYFADIYPDEGISFIQPEYNRNGRPSIAGKYMLSNFPESVGMLKTGKPFVISDIHGAQWLSQTSREAYAAIEFASHASVPLVKDGKLVWALTVSTETPRLWTDQDLALLQECGERTWDAVERARAEEALRESESRLATIFESLPVGAGLIDRQGKLVLANQEMRRFLPTGIIPSQDEENYGRWRGYHPDGRRIERSDYVGLRALRGERVLPGIEFLYTQDDGREIWTTIARLPFRDSDGRITGAITVVTDIDQTKRATEALRQSEERFRTSLENLAEAFVMYSAVRRNGEIVDFRYEYVNDQACAFHHLSREQLVGHTLLEIIPAVKETGLFDQYTQVVETGEPLRGHQYVSNDHSGRSRAQGVFDFRVSKFGDGMIITANDISERLRLEAEQQQAIQEREIHHRLTEHREMERQSIARDIHDGPIQTLSGLVFHLKFLNDMIGDLSLKLELEQVALNVKGAVQELRQVMNELRPPSVIRFGLSKAILLHSEHLREHSPQIEWHFQLAEDGNILPEQTCLALFRIYQEAINNILRHSQARKAWIQYQVLKNRVTLEIRDNGKGFSDQYVIADLTQDKHFGLAGITERAEAMNANLAIKTKPGQGTTIHVEVPILKSE